MSRAQTPKRLKESHNQERRTITPTDLETLNFKELKAIQKAATDLLNSVEEEDLNPDDLLLVYDIRLVSKDGTVYTNKGRSPMNAILKQRVLAEAPKRFELEFQHNIFSPVYAAAFDLFDKVNPTTNSVHLLENGDDEDDLLAIGGPEPDPTNIG